MNTDEVTAQWCNSDMKQYSASYNEYTRQLKAP